MKKEIVKEDDNMPRDNAANNASNEVKKQQEAKNDLINKVDEINSEKDRRSFQP